MSSLRFPKSARLLKSAEFDRVMKRRQSAGDGLIVAYAAPNDLEHSRLGLIVSRKVGNAVVRNRWKRLLREAFRLEQSDLPQGLDIVILPRRGAEPDLTRLRKSLLRLAEKINDRFLSDSDKKHQPGTTR